MGLLPITELSALRVRRSWAKELSRGTSTRGTSLEGWGLRLLGGSSFFAIGLPWAQPRCELSNTFLQLRKEPLVVTNFLWRG